MAIAAFVIMGVGVALIFIGVYVSLRDWSEKQRRVEASEGFALDKSIGALAKLADALKGHPLGMQLILVGIVVILVGGVIGGVAAL